MLLDKIEYWHNRASDTRFVWFPFEKLRPLKTQPIELRRRLVMSLTFGIYYGVYSSLRKVIFGNSIELSQIIRAAFIAIGVFFLWFSTVTSFFWNRRARRLTEGEASAFSADRK